MRLRGEVTRDGRVNEREWVREWGTNLRRTSCIADDVGLAFLDAELCVHAANAPLARNEVTEISVRPHLMRASMQVTGAVRV